MAGSKPLKLFFWLFGSACVVVIYYLSLEAIDFNAATFGTDIKHFFGFLGRMVPPDFSNFDQLINPLLKTFQMAILGAFLGALLSVPLIIFGSQIITQTPFIFWPVRMLMNLIRTVPDLLYAVLFVVALGYDLMAGVGALTFFSCAIISKLTSESADNINRKPIEAVQATGARRFQVIRFGIMPQLLPAFMDHLIYVLELNVRVSAVLGFVGLGGIGQQWLTALDWLNYKKALAVILVIFALVVIIDLIGNRIRDTLLYGGQLRKASRVFFNTLTIVGSIALIFWSWSSLELSLQRILDGLASLKNVGSAMVNPIQQILAFSGLGALFGIVIENPEATTVARYGEHALVQMGQSLAIALLGTTISFVLAFPLGLLASRKHTGIPEPVAIGIKQVSNAIRAFPELVLAVFFAASFGFGPMAGVLAIGLHSIGMMGKMNAEIVEKIRKEQVEALQATGAKRLQVFQYGILPQLLPEFIALGIYRFEIDIRAAAVLGVVGAGGIGKLLKEAQDFRNWELVGLCLLVIIPVVITIDFLSARIRRRLIEGAASN